MKVEDFKTLHLITLSGGGDTYHKLVGPATFDWLFGDFESTQSGYYEKIPQEVQEEFSVFDPEWNKNNKNGEFHITRGSYDNDRAIQAIGLDFNSASKACKWAIEKGIELGEEYDGYVY